VGAWLGVCVGGGCVIRGWWLCNKFGVVLVRGFGFCYEGFNVVGWSPCCRGQEAKSQRATARLEETEGPTLASRDVVAEVLTLDVTVIQATGVPVGSGMWMDTSARSSRPAATSDCRGLRLIRVGCGDDDDRGSADAAAASSSTQTAAATVRVSSMMVQEASPFHCLAVSLECG